MIQTHRLIFEEDKIGVARLHLPFTFELSTYPLWASVCYDSFPVCLAVYVCEG